MAAGMSGGSTAPPKRKRRTPPHPKGVAFGGRQVINKPGPKRRTVFDKTG